MNMVDGRSMQANSLHCGDANVSMLQGCLEKWSFRPNSALCSEFYPRNINYMPAVKFITMP